MVSTPAVGLQRSSRRAAVLLVDSDGDSRDMYAEYLRVCGFEVHTATTTDDGLIRASGVDVVVTGIRVPGSCDGVGFVHRLRDADATKRLPIIVLTACAWETEQRRAIAAGCDVFLPKPCLPERLTDEIRSLVALRDIPKPRPAQAHAADRRRRRAN